MPLFAKKGNKYIGALQCGAGRDAYLEFELSPTPIEEIEIYKLKPLKNGLSNETNPEKIKESAILGTDRAFKEINERYYLKSLGYIPNDSEHYELHERIVYSIIERIHNGGNFKLINEQS